MLEQEDLKWIAGTSTDLNSMLQQITRYADLAQRHKGEHHYIDLLVQRVNLAARTAQRLFDRVTNTILAKTAAKTAAPTPNWPPPFRVLAPSVPPFPAQVAESEALSVNEEKSKSSASSRTPSRTQWNWSAGVGLPPEIKVLNAKGNREYILFVDDDPEIAALTSEMLAEEGYKIIVAKDGFEALEIYGKIGKQIGLVILDFFLPVMDGDAVFDELRALNQKVNVVLSSGFAEQSKINAMLKQGLRGFMPKPYTREKLLAQVRSILDAARQALQ